MNETFNPYADDSSLNIDENKKEEPIDHEKNARLIDGWLDSLPRKMRRQFLKTKFSDDFKKKAKL